MKLIIITLISLLTLGCQQRIEIPNRYLSLSNKTCTDLNHILVNITVYNIEGDTEIKILCSDSKYYKLKIDYSK